MTANYAHMPINAVFANGYGSYMKTVPLPDTPGEWRADKMTEAQIKLPVGYIWAPMYPIGNPGDVFVPPETAYMYILMRVLTIPRIELLPRALPDGGCMERVQFRDVVLVNGGEGVLGYGVRETDQYDPRCVTWEKRAGSEDEWEVVGPERPLTPMLQQPFVPQPFVQYDPGFYPGVEWQAPPQVGMQQDMAWLPLLQDTWNQWAPVQQPAFQENFVQQPAVLQAPVPVVDDHANGRGKDWAMFEDLPAIPDFDALASSEAPMAVEQEGPAQAVEEDMPERYRELLLQYVNAEYM